MYNVLVIYAYHRFPMRTALWNHLYSFRRNGKCRCVYVNLRYRNLPRLTVKYKFDLVVFDTNFVGQRWSRQQFKEIMKKAEPLKALEAIKVMIPQDEFLNTDLLNDFINDFGIDHVFTNLPGFEIPKVYDRVPSGIGFTRVLTGYLEPKTLKKVSILSRQSSQRNIDIGYRAAGLPWFGRHGLKKIHIGDLVKKATKGQDLVVDIDTEQNTEASRLKGDNWLRFLLSCRYTLGAEGGTSIHDRDGTLKASVDAYLKQYPDADFKQIEAACFPGRDGELKLFALSPRHLEACATGTCQILVEGEYDDVLKPETHYLPVKDDFSNLEDVLSRLDDEDMRENVVQRARRDIVDSGRYTYDAFVETVLQESLGDSQSQTTSALPTFLVGWNRVRDLVSWVKVWFIDRFFTPTH